MSTVETKPTIHLATDHAGLVRKEEIKTWLLDAGYDIVDHGAYTLDPEDDFPDFISKAAKEVSVAPQIARAIILGGSGNGEAMMANRYPGVRAAVYYGGAVDIVTLAREHNDANVLSIGARFVSKEEAIDAVNKWLTTPVLSEDKRVRRNQKIEVYTKEIRASL